VKVILVDHELAELDDPDNCTSLSVEAYMSRRSARYVLTADQVGELDEDGEHVWLEPTALERLAGDRVSPDWSQRFSAMLQMARSKGWANRSGAVRAHCVWRTSAIL
jgi:hypothetical protein